MAGSWDAAAPGVLTLPSGLRVRGRAWRDVPAPPLPDLGIYLLARAVETRRQARFVTGFDGAR
jgi:hypothetical protein